ncbi:glycine--tRNA ligase [bacterium]|nr:glycine--tRNA ligase [bacterium]
MADLSQIVAFCGRRGLVFPGSSLHGGLSGCWDYGPAGTALKRRIESLWWQEVVEKNSDIVGLDAAILMPPPVWQASGHEENFSDPMVDCRACKARLKAEDFDSKKSCSCGATDWTDPRQFNLMLSTQVGAMEDSATRAYLRPETAQGIFVNAIQVARLSRLPIPFGIAQVGKAFRNEITPRNFLFRVREFTQMEVEIFCHPEESQDLFNSWVEKRMAFYSKTLGIRSKHLHTRIHNDSELAHYAQSCIDVEYDFPFGRRELEGVADRGTWDLDQHAAKTGKNLTLSHPEKGKFVPAVVEASAGLDRTFLTVISDALDTTDPKHTILRIHPRLAEHEVALFPLVRKEGMPERALELASLLGEKFRTKVESRGSIGKRYFREDEAGTPLAITVDGQTAVDRTVTLRFRDRGEQIRLEISDLHDGITKALEEKPFWP